MHYSTKQIMNSVYQNILGHGFYNDRIQIMQGDTGGFSKPAWQHEPCSMEAFQLTVPTTDIILSFPEYLDHIFEDGAQLIIETYEGADDDGGTCYQAFILDVDWVHHFWRDFNASNLIQSVNLTLFTVEFIINNPEAFMVVWAGPY